MKALYKAATYEASTNAYEFKRGYRGKEGGSQGLRVVFEEAEAVGGGL
jgi:hypothetical protein